MKLNDYLRPNGLVPASELARHIGAHHQSVRDWSKGRANCPAVHACKIEEITGGRVSRAELVPKWRSIWPDYTPPAGADVLGEVVL